MNSEMNMNCSLENEDHQLPLFIFEIFLAHSSLHQWENNIYRIIVNDPKYHLKVLTASLRISAIIIYKISTCFESNRTDSSMKQYLSTKDDRTN